MNANSSWGEVRWREPQSNPSSHDPTMATQTLLSRNRIPSTDGHEDQHARLLEPHRRIDQGIHMPHANLHIRGPTNIPDNNRLLSESRLFPDHMTNALYRPQNTSITSPPSHFDETRTGSMSDHVDHSRRTSELQPTSDARTSNGACWILSFSADFCGEKYILCLYLRDVRRLSNQRFNLQIYPAFALPTECHRKLMLLCFHLLPLSRSPQIVTTGRGYYRTLL